jgi:hypothetical protein
MINLTQPRKNRNRKRSKVEVQTRKIEPTIAAIAAGFLPVASYVVAHIEAAEKPYLYVLVVAALAYSAPTLSTWAQKWAHHWMKAWGFTVLLEGTMILSHIQALSLTGLGILVLINSTTAYRNSTKNKQ